MLKLKIYEYRVRENMTLLVCFAAFSGGSQLQNRICFHMEQILSFEDFHSLKAFVVQGSRQECFHLLKGWNIWIYPYTLTLSSHLLYTQF